jgi:hypothetical protein
MLAHGCENTGGWFSSFAGAMLQEIIEAISASSSSAVFAFDFGFRGRAASAALVSGFFFAMLPVPFWTGGVPPGRLPLALLWVFSGEAGMGVACMPAHTPFQGADKQVRGDTGELLPQRWVQ